MKRKLISTAQWLQRRAENVSVALLSVMFATFIVQIFARYVLNKPIGWSEEVIITTWLWTVLWGAAFILGEAEEIRFDIISGNVGPSARRAFVVVTSVALVVLLFVVTWIALRFEGRAFLTAAGFGVWTFSGLELVFLLRKLRRKLRRIAPL